MGDLAPGTVFAGHRIDAVAGHGGMGVVYRATQLALDRTVALKVIAPGQLEDETVRQRFVREAKVAASIDHPNVVPIYYAGEDDGVAYIAMRYVAGDDVRSLVRREGPLAPSRAARIVAQIGSALDAAHAAGLVHRDIKPANVLITPDDHVYLTDFGLTKHAVSVGGGTRAGHWVGTLDYVAPEQIRGERVDARADVYALGCLLYFTLTGEVPFARHGDEAKLWAHLSEPPPKPSDHGSPQELDAVVARALAKEPDERYQSAGDLGRAARAAAAGEQRAPEHERLVATGAAAPLEAPTTSSPRPKPEPTVEAETVVLRARRRRRLWRPLAAIGALLAAAGTGVLIAVALGGSDAPPATPTQTATATAAAGPRIAAEIEVGTRPNVVRVADVHVFVASFREDRIALVDPQTNRIRRLSPRVGFGATDAAIEQNSLWLTLSSSQRIAHVDVRTGRLRDSGIAVPGSPSAIAAGSGALWVALKQDAPQPDLLLKISQRTGTTLASVPYPSGISSLALSPSAVWIANSRAKQVQRADPRTGSVVRTVPIGESPPEDLAYRDGSLWIATPGDDTVYRLMTQSGNNIPISVGRRPRQLALGDGVVYVVNYNSSDLYTIDEERSRVVGTPLQLPVNPYSIAVDEDVVWVSSLPENRLSKVVTGRAG